MLLVRDWINFWDIMFFESFPHFGRYTRSYLHYVEQSVIERGFSVNKEIPIENLIFDIPEVIL